MTARPVITAEEVAEQTAALNAKEAEQRAAMSARVKEMAGRDDGHEGLVLEQMERLSAVEEAKARLRNGGQTAGNAPDRPLYVDVAALLAGGLPEGLKPSVLRRTDTHALFYAERVNYLFGDPESGKTWVALAAMAEALVDGADVEIGNTVLRADQQRPARRALFLDLDHNGADELVAHLLLLGAPEAVLADPERLRIAEPEDAAHLAQIVADATEWLEPGDVAVADSIGELLPLLDLNSNSADDYTAANRRVLVPLAAAGAAVIGIDHLAKAAESRAQGAIGTGAKRRAVSGVSLRVSLRETFIRGRGGACALTVHKDRPGGLREHSPQTAVGKEPCAGVFAMRTELGMTSWAVWPVKDEEGDGEVSEDDGLAQDVALLGALDPAPKSQRDVQTRMHWGGTRAGAALKAWRAHRSGSAPRAPGAPGASEADALLPCSPPLSRGAGEHGRSRVENPANQGVGEASTETGEPRAAEHSPASDIEQKE
jgi:hypothetical protein